MIPLLEHVLRNVTAKEIYKRKGPSKSMQKFREKIFMFL